MDPLWCTVNARIFSFYRRQNLNYMRFFRKLYPHSLNSQDFLHTIIIISRRGSIKTTKIFCENYEYTGHSLDTITAWFFRLQDTISCAFIVSCALFGHSRSNKKPPHQERLVGLISLSYWFCRSRKSSHEEGV